MKLPTEDKCTSDPFLNLEREADKKQFLSTRWGSNQKFQSHRRIYTSFELMKKYLPKKSNIPIADFGCGSSSIGLLFAEEGYEVDMLDNEPKLFEYIKLKMTEGNVNFIEGDAWSYRSGKQYFGIFLGEVIEHMADPLETLKNIRENLATGGILCLTTPNGDFVKGREPKWNDIKDQKERNEKLANSRGNHVCEFSMCELKELVREAGYSLLEHNLIISDQISRSSLVRRVFPKTILWALDDMLAKRTDPLNRTWGQIQVLVALRDG